MWPLIRHSKERSYPECRETANAVLLDVPELRGTTMDIRLILDKCRGGETVDLSGKTIDPFYIRNYTFPRRVTLRGGRYLAKPESERAFRLDSCSNLSFEDAEVSGVDRSAMGFLAVSSKEIALRRLNIHGLKHGVGANKCDGFTIEECTFRNLRIDAFRSGGSRRVRVLSNYGTDFHPINTGGKGDHPDFIQFWPLYGSDNSEIEIIGNRFERGDGLPAQGIFVRGVYRDKKTGKEKRPQFGRVVVCSNVIDGGLWNGISVSGVKSGQITDNVIIGRKGEKKKSWLRVSEVNMVIRGNVAEKFLGDIDESKNSTWRHGLPAPKVLSTTCS